MNIKQKEEIKIQQLDIYIFLNQTLLKSIDFFLLYVNHGNKAKRLNALKYYLSKGIIKNYNVIINGKNVYEQAIETT